MTLFFLFLGAMLAIIVYMLYSFRYIFAAFLILFVIIIIIKAHLEAKKFGYRSLWGAFKKTSNENNQMNLIQYILKQKKGIHYIFQRENKIIIALSESGIYIIKVLEQIGNITGKIEEPFLTVKDKTLASLPNFFLELSILEEEIKKSLPSARIQKIIVKKGISIIDISYSREYQIYSTHDFYYQLEKLEKQKCYTEKQVDELNNTISHVLSNIVK